jgi:hypothetical protein
MQDKAEIARHNRKRGKRVQKKISDRLNAENIGTLGGEDCKTSNLSIECKGLKKFVGVKYMEQAEKNNIREVLPVVVVHVIGTKYDEDIVMIRFKEFKKLI